MFEQFKSMSLIVRYHRVLHSSHCIEHVQESHEVYEVYPCMASGGRIKIDLFTHIHIHTSRAGIE